MEDSEKPVIGSFYSRSFDFQDIDFENTLDDKVFINCYSVEDYIQYKISKQEAIEMALAILKNCL